MRTSSKRKLTPFSLSFLDIMSCGFGAVILLFLIIKHNIDTNVPMPTTSTNKRSEVNLLEEEIKVGEKDLVRVRNTISEIDQQLVEAQGLAERIISDIKAAEGVTNELVEDADTAAIEQLKDQIKELEVQRAQLIKELNQTGEDMRKVAGDGDRAYITGLKMGGRHILVLLDVSASMLDDTIVNILRRRNMREGRQRTAPKWQNATDIVGWLTAKFPVDSEFQVYLFNTESQAAIPESKGRWLAAKDRTLLEQVVNNLDQIVPEKGTNLEQAFAAAAELRPQPDNIFLITDGLPTQGTNGPRSATINGNQRLKLFATAITKLPRGTPVNVILAPLEGDPEAANAYWQLARNTRGSFMSPSEDWP